MTITLEPSTEQQVIQRATQLGQQPQEYLRDVIADALGKPHNQVLSLVAIGKENAPAQVAAVPPTAEGMVRGPYYEEWKQRFELMAKLRSDDFFADGRCQPEEQQYRPALDELFNDND